MHPKGQPVREGTRAQPFEKESAGQSQIDTQAKKDAARHADEELEINRKLSEFTGRLASFTLLLAIFTGGLIVVGALQFVALNRQARTLVHHSELLGTSVAAAQRTSQALMDGQRGWILVEKVDQPDMRLVMDARFQGTVPFFVFRFKVSGFTPCKIRNAAMRFHLAEAMERELQPRLPPKPEY